MKSKNVEGRVLLFSQGEAASAQYIPFMNAVFEAQRQVFKTQFYDAKYFIFD